MVENMKNESTTKEKMLVTKALNELKLLDSRINKAIQYSNFVMAAKTSDKNVTPNMTKVEFVDKTRANYQSIIDMINRRSVIKAAVVTSNAVTLVEINGETMTVAKAIEMKTSIEYEAGLLRVLKNQLANAESTMNQANLRLESKIDNMLETMISKEAKTKKEDFNEVVTPIRESGECSIVDPINIKEKIELLDNKVSGFMAEVDSVLQISNCITYIEI